MHQCAAARGFASQASPTCLTCLNRANNPQGPTEQPAAELSQFSKCHVECESPGLEQRTPAGGEQ